MAMPHPTGHMRVRRFSGNTLPECLLIAVLMQGIATTGFLVFGKSLNGSTGTIKRTLAPRKKHPWPAL